SSLLVKRSISLGTFFDSYFCHFDRIQKCFPSKQSNTGCNFSPTTVGCWSDFGLPPTCRLALKKNFLFQSGRSFDMATAIFLPSWFLQSSITTSSQTVVLQ